MKRGLCAAILSLQAIVLGLTTPVLITVNGVGRATGLAVGLGLLIACVLAAGMLRKRWAYGLGWAIQIASLALGFLITPMIVLGTVFAVLWASAYFLGEKIERERAQWEDEAAASAPGASD